MQAGKKNPTRATDREAGLLEELLSQPNTYQKSQPPSWLLRHHRRLLLGEQSTEKSPLLEAHAFKQNWEKSRWDQLHVKETALSAHPSEGQTGTEQG